MNKGIVMVVVSAVSAYSMACSSAPIKPESRPGKSASPCPTAHGEMVLVPAGPFPFGPRNQPIAVGAFCIDKFEVRATEYQRCVSMGGCRGHGKWPQCRDGAKNAPNSCLRNPGSLPANWMDWFRAAEYCAWAGKSLPTEQQWEKAARGTDGRPYPWGGDIDCTKAHWGRGPGFASCKGSGGRPDALMPVTAYADIPSPYGAVQLAGNVREWVDHRKVRSRPAADSGYGVSKGGTFRMGKGGVSAVARFQLLGPGVASDSQGFRCVAPALTAVPNSR